MILKDECFIGVCDNCGELFHNGDYSMFPLRPDVEEQMMANEEWYANGADPNHQGKHYCPNCFKFHETEDDTILVDSSRFVLDKYVPAESPSPDGWAEITFGSHLKCLLQISGSEVKVNAAVNGWGDSVPSNEILVTPCPAPETKGGAND